MPRIRRSRRDGGHRAVESGNEPRTRRDQHRPRPRPRGADARGGRAARGAGARGHRVHGQPAPASPFAELGLTYDDVLLQPGETDVIPSEVDTTTRLTREISIRVPLVSAAMDTVTEARMAIAMARHGGIGILHRNLSIEDQAYQVDLVKRTQTGMISNPVTIGQDATLEELDEICGRYRVSGLPVVDAGDHLLGIVTNRDLRFTPVAEWGHTSSRRHDPDAADHRARRHQPRRGDAAAAPAQARAPADRRRRRAACAGSSPSRTS